MTFDDAPELEPGDLVKFTNLSRFDAEYLGVERGEALPVDHIEVDGPLVMIWCLFPKLGCKLWTPHDNMERAGPAHPAHLKDLLKAYTQ